MIESAARGGIVRLRRFLAPPIFDDADSTGTARMNYMVVLTIAVVGTLLQLTLAAAQPGQALRQFVVVAVLDVCCLVIIILTRRGFLSAAGWFETLVFWALFTLLGLTGGGVNSPVLNLELMLLATLAVMVLGRRGSLAIAALCIATVIGMGLAQDAGALRTEPVLRTSLSVALGASGIILLVTFLQSTIAGNLRSARDRAVEGLAQRRAAELLSDTLIDSAPGFFFTLDAGGRFLRWNRRTEILTGEPAARLMGKDALELVHEDDQPLVAAMLAQAFASGLAETEARILTPDGTRYHLLTGRRMDFDGAPVLVGFGVDVTERKKLEHELRDLSLRDQLTGLYNRRGFGAIAAQQLRVARRLGEDVVVAFVDVDGLKRLNDTQGHAAGDQALQAVAQALLAGLRDADTIARVGGDEFAFLMVEPGELDEDALAARLAAQLGDRANVEDAARPLSVSLGMARFDPSSPETLDELLHRADAAMYRRKGASSRFAG
jgi:diguanylate cyclase (GGDEF)-like protein/PAS domain S-box-containing protein